MFEEQQHWFIKKSWLSKWGSNNGGNHEICSILHKTKIKLMGLGIWTCQTYFLLKYKNTHNGNSYDNIIGNVVNYPQHVHVTYTRFW